jgi:cytochrome c-type biogenesis protein
MGELLQFFDSAFSASAPVALAAAVAWGALSVMLSPCHLSSIPLIVAYMGGDGAPPGPRRAFAISSSFAAGILGSIALVGLATAAVGRMLGDVGPIGTYLLAAVFIAVGLNLLGVLPLPSFLSAPSSSGARRGPLGALLLGLLFGVALGPCTFAFMAPVLGVALRSAKTTPGYGALLVLLYGLGHAAVIALAGVFGDSVQRYLTWSAGSRGPAIIRGVAGVLVILGGVYFLITGR